MLAVMAFDNPEDWRLWLRYWPILILPIILVIPREHFLAITAQIWLVPLMVLGSVLNPDNLIGRILEFRLIKAIGKISYSLYLWQQLFFTQHLYGAMLVKIFALRYLLLFALATASYWLIEQLMIDSPRGLGQVLEKSVTWMRRKLSRLLAGTPVKACSRTAPRMRVAVSAPVRAQCRAQRAFFFKLERRSTYWIVRVI